jgi:hypothetical protein
VKNRQVEVNLSPRRGEDMHAEELDTLLCCLTVITHSSIAILLMDPRGGHIATLAKSEKTLQNTFGFISHILRGSISKIAMLAG